MTQPQPADAQINIGVGVVNHPTSGPLVQIRYMVGPTAFVLEMPAEMALQMAAHMSEQVDQAATAIRRAQLGVPGLILPTNGSVPR